MNSLAKAQYVIRLLYVPEGYHENKNKEMYIIGDFNGWQREKCEFDASLGMYYFDLKTDSLKRIEFKFYSKFMADRNYGDGESYMSSGIYEKVTSQAHQNNILDIENLSFHQ